MSTEPKKAEVTSENQLSDVITALYYARHHLDEIPPIKEKIHHLQNMLSTLEADQNLQVTSDSLENNLRQLQSELNDQVEKQERQEQTVINGIKSILKKEEENILSKVTSKADSNKEFENYGRLLVNQIQKYGKVMEEELNNLKASIKTIDFKGAVDNIKTSMMTEQERLISMLNQQSKADYHNRFAKLTEVANKLNVHDHLRQQTNTGISMIKAVNVEIEKERKQREEERANDPNIPDAIKEIVTLELIRHEPLMQTKAVEIQVKTVKEHQARFQALKKETSKIIASMAEHKFMMDDARIWYNTLRDPAPKKSVDVLKQEEIIKEIDSVHDDITEISNEIEAKMKDMKQQIENANGATENFTSSNSRKRQRKEQEEDLDQKIKDADIYIQQLDDYISQFKEAVLDPMFPIRVETAMKKIQHILVNHETFIAYLINPKPVTKDIEAGKSRQVDPAMLHKICAIVNAQKESTSERLFKKLKSLEDSIAS